jgi:hypothetical protein
MRAKVLRKMQILLRLRRRLLGPRLVRMVGLPCFPCLLLLKEKEL